MVGHSAKAFGTHRLLSAGNRQDLVKKIVKMRIFYKRDERDKIAKKYGLTDVG